MMKQILVMTRKVAPHLLYKNVLRESFVILSLLWLLMDQARAQQSTKRRTERTSVMKEMLSIEFAIAVETTNNWTLEYPPGSNLLWGFD